jgi:hypothetical protein
MTVSSTIPPVECSSVDRVDWRSGNEDSDEGVMLSRKASAPGPEKWCWTLDGLAQEHDWKIVGVMVSTQSKYEVAVTYICPTSNKLAFSRVQLCESMMLISLYWTGMA